MIIAVVATAYVCISELSCPWSGLIQGSSKSRIFKAMFFKTRFVHHLRGM